MNLGSLGSARQGSVWGPISGNSDVRRVRAEAPFMCADSVVCCSIFLRDMAAVLYGLELLLSLFSLLRWALE